MVVKIIAPKDDKQPLKPWQIAFVVIGSVLTFITFVSLILLTIYIIKLTDNGPFELDDDAEVWVGDDADELYWDERSELSKPAHLSSFVNQEQPSDGIFDGYSLDI